MEKNKIFTQIATNEYKDVPSDYDAPYSFLEWKQRIPSFVESNIIFYYQEYVKNWFEENKNKQVSKKFLLRQKFLYLLEQLQLFFNDNEKTSWYKKINLASEKELMLAIPYFAKKLKDISLYYLKIRKKLKNTKLKYNTVGTNSGLEQDVYNLLLESFSSSSEEIDPDLKDLLPEFNDIKRRLVAEIQELYDDGDYVDHSSTEPLSSYIDLFHPATADFFATKGIILSSSEWVFKTFNIPVESNFDTILGSLTGTILETSDADLYQNFLQKYLSERKLSLVFSLSSPVIEVTDVNLYEGSNFFYYPYNITDSSLSIANKIPSVPLSSIDFSTLGTSGSSIELADTIFTKNGTDIRGAWLAKTLTNKTHEIMSAELNQSERNRFIFPYPGYGLSGDGLTWTGSSLSSVFEYQYLSRESKAAVNNEYWSQTLSTAGIDPIFINNTTLQKCGSKPGINLNLSDIIYTYSVRSENILEPLQQVDGAWLFDFQKTSLPVSPGGINVMLWPYMLLDTESDFPEEFSNSVFDEVCINVPVSSSNLRFAQASFNFENSDKIYKLNNFTDDIENAVECIWLSGKSDVSYPTKYIKQDNFSALFVPGQTTKFVWTGPNTNIDSIFSSYEHEPLCPLAIIGSSAFILSSANLDACSCKQSYHAPFGHPGNQYDDYDGHSDFIAVDHEHSNLPFDLASWKDTSNQTYKTSTDFAWYKTSRTKPTWGYGSWLTNFGTPASLQLQTGKTYFYNRVNNKKQNENISPYIINFSFATNNSKWIRARKDGEGQWFSTEEPSTFEFKPGSVLKYGRSLYETHYILSAVQVENESKNTGSVWCTTDSIAIDTPLNYTLVNWPALEPPVGIAPGSGQYPLATMSQISEYVSWVVKDAATSTVVLSVSGESILSFIPATTGIYSITPTVLLVDGTTYTFSGVPLISVIPQYGTQDIEVEAQRPIPGFVIEQPLSRYANKQYNIIAPGGTPYWAKLYVNKEPNTNQRGVFSSDFPLDYVDGYLPNSNPKYSPLKINYGTVIEYSRIDQDPVTWVQPLSVNVSNESVQWKKLNFAKANYSTLSSLYLSKQQLMSESYATQDPSDIILTNNLNGKPVEVFYDALNSFTWPVSVEKQHELQDPTVTTKYQNSKTFLNFANRFFPTVASVPVLERAYSIDDVGGYFIPLNLGASHFINKDFESFLKNSNSEGTYLTEDTNIHLGGLGLTKEDQPTLYGWNENNQWLKESVTTGALAGSIKKELTKSLQTFVPYDSNDLKKSYGLFTPENIVSPWGGSTMSEWTDVERDPKSFTGVHNVSAWTSKQIIQEHDKIADKWATDIFGNQYSLYKNLSGIPVSERINVPGNLWAKKNDGEILPAHLALSAIFDPFKVIPSVYHSLTGDGIYYFDSFLETILIELSSCIITSRLTYNYDSHAISSSYDDTRVISLTAPNATIIAGQNWFFSNEKKLVINTTTLSGTTMLPVLHELDLTTRALKTIFPSSEDEITIQNSLQGIQIKSVDRGLLFYNKLLKRFVITYLGKRVDDEMFVINFTIERIDGCTLSRVDLYNPDNIFTSSSFNVNMPPVVSNNLSSIDIGAYTNTFTAVITALHNPTSYTLLNYTGTVTVNNSGVFVGTVPSPGIHHINYELSNSYGSSVYCLTVIAH